MRIDRRIAACVAASVLLNVWLVSWAHRSGWFNYAPEREARTIGVRIDRFVVPSPRPAPTPSPHWDRLDRSAVRYVKAFPDHLQIVLTAAKRSNGAPSDAPDIYRVDISPPRVHARSLLHLSAYTSPDANGVYVRFAIWEIALSPAGPGVFPSADRDFPGRPYELFERDYAMPPIPTPFANRMYNVQFAAVGRTGLASGTYVPLYLEGPAPH
jgi:hypothetical protein